MAARAAKSVISGQPEPPPILRILPSLSSKRDKYCIVLYVFHDVNKFGKHESYRLNVCVPPQFIYRNLNPNAMALAGGALGSTEV